MNNMKLNMKEEDFGQGAQIWEPVGAERLVLTVQEAAAALDLSCKSIYRLIARGKLRCISSLRHKRIPKSELERFIRFDLK